MARSSLYSCTSQASKPQKLIKSDKRRGMIKGKRGFFAWLWFVVWRFLLLLVLILLLLRFVPLSTTAFMLQSPYPVTQHWINIDKLPAHVPMAMVASEDQRFPQHFGVDFNAISKAPSRNKRQKTSYYGRAEVLCAKVSKRVWRSALK